jgi:hypothetical protein
VAQATRSSIQTGTTAREPSGISQIATELPATVVRVDDRDALPDERVPGVVNLASVTDTGRMKRSLSLREESVAATAHGVERIRSKCSPVSLAPSANGASI